MLLTQLPSYLVPCDGKPVFRARRYGGRPSYSTERWLWLGSSHSTTRYRAEGVTDLDSKGTYLMCNFTSLTITPSALAESVYAQVSALARTLKLEGTHILSRTSGSQVEILVSQQLFAIL